MGLQTIFEDREITSTPTLIDARSKKGSKKAGCPKKAHEVAKSLANKYGTDGSALIDNDVEMTTVLKSFSLEVFGISEAPSRQDIVFLRYIAEQEELQSYGTSAAFGCILHAVIDTWSAYLERVNTVRGLAHLFDSDRSGKIEAPELRALLEAIHGKTLPNEVVQWGFKQADITGHGALSGMELARAIACYYRWLGKPDPIGDGRRLKGGIEVPEMLPDPPESLAPACCIIS